MPQLSVLCLVGWHLPFEKSGGRQNTEMKKNVPAKYLLLCLRFLGKKEQDFIPGLIPRDVLTMTVLSRRVELEVGKHDRRELA